MTLTPEPELPLLADSMLTSMSGCDTLIYKVSAQGCQNQSHELYQSAQLSSLYCVHDLTMRRLNNKRLLFLGLWLLFCSGAFLFSSSCLFAREACQATVIRVSDGDTVWVLINGRQRKLRLLGIDTPEKFASRKLSREAAHCGVSEGYKKNLGQMATHYAKKLLTKGQKVRLVSYGRGYYGRVLGVIYLPDGTCYNEKIVEDGYACVYKYHGHKSSQLPWTEWIKLNRLLDKARRHKRGLWSVDYTVMDCLCR